MSTVSVYVGERVSGGQRVGRIGMTGRTFGPHVHFELYPAGVTPGHLYQAINPAPWLHRKGLHY
jgi:murein DD-endopeptidase MepM/ murein hydrolase activator NlpD